MSALSSIVNVQISRQTSVPTRAGFGTGAFLSAQASFPDPSKIYNSLTELLEAGDAGADSEAAAAAYFGQQLAPTKLTVIKEITGQAQVTRLTFSTDLITGNSTVITLDGVAGTPVVFTTDHDTTMAAIAASVATDFPGQATAAVTGGAGSRVIEVTYDVVDTPFAVSAVVTLGDSQPTVDSTITTVAGGFSGTLTEAIAYDNDWYGLGIYSRVKADIAEVSDYIQGLGSSNPKLFLAQNAAESILNPGNTTDIASELTAKSNFRTSVWYHAIDSEYLDMAMLGGQLPTDAGSITWAYKQAATVTVDDLSTGEKSAAHGKNCNTYTEVASVNISEEGKTCDGGSGEWIDVIRGVDFIQVNMQADLYTVLVQNAKVPYDDSGIGLMKATVLSRLNQAQGQGILRADVIPQVIAPLRDQIPAGDVAARVLNDLEFSAILAGAIQKVNVQGVVTL
jgi:hypothetical protein